MLPGTRTSRHQVLRVLPVPVGSTVANLKPAVVPVFGREGGVLPSTRWALRLSSRWIRRNMAGPHWQDLLSSRRPERPGELERGTLSVTNIVGASCPSLQNGPLTMTIEGSVSKARVKFQIAFPGHWCTYVYMAVPVASLTSVGRLKFQIYSKLQWHWSRDLGSALAVQSRCQAPAARPGKLPPYSESHMWPTAVSLASAVKFEHPKVVR